MQEIAQKYGKIALVVLIRWGLQHGTSVLVKSSNPAHIRVRISDAACAAQLQLSLQPLTRALSAPAWACSTCDVKI